MLRVAAHRVAGCVASLLSDDEVAVRAAALTTLLELGAGAEPYLRAAPCAAAAIVSVLAEGHADRGWPRAVALATALDDDTAPYALAVHLDSGDGKARYFAAQALVACGRMGVQILVDALSHAHVTVRRRACEGLRDAASAAVGPALLGALKDADVKVRQNAARALAVIGSAEGIDALRPLLNDAAKAVRATVRCLVAS